MHPVNTPVLSAGESSAVPTDSLQAIAQWCGADEATTSAAEQATAPRLVVSGRLASGKDTVAEAAMEALGHPESVQISFATALRDEVGELLDVVRVCPDHEAAVQAVAERTGLDGQRVRNTATLLWQAIQLDPRITPWTRTREMRLALQDWGTEVRRAVDPHYWVKRGALRALQAAATNSAVRITDARFINEVEVARALGFFAVRLEVELVTRAQRLWDRDGLTIDPASETHPSEVELESYKGFDLWVSNNGPLTETVDDLLVAYRRQTS